MFFLTMPVGAQLCSELNSAETNGRWHNTCVFIFWFWFQKSSISMFKCPQMINYLESSLSWLTRFGSRTQSQSYRAPFQCERCFMADIVSDSCVWVKPIMFTGTKSTPQLSNRPLCLTPANTKSVLLFFGEAHIVQCRIKKHFFQF